MCKNADFKENIEVLSCTRHVLINSEYIWAEYEYKYKYQPWKIHEYRVHMSTRDPVLEYTSTWVLSTMAPGLNQESRMFIGQHMWYMYNQDNVRNI